MRSVKSGNLHLGNYLGAIRNWVELQASFDCIFCIVDLHALTQPQDPDTLRAHTREVTAAYLASGIDPERDAQAIYQLAVGWLQRRLVSGAESSAEDAEHIVSFAMNALRGESSQGDRAEINAT